MPPYVGAMITSSNGNLFRLTGPLWGVSTGIRLHKRLSKQSGCQWFETPSCSLRRHCHDYYPVLVFDNALFCLWFPCITVHIFLHTKELDTILNQNVINKLSISRPNMSLQYIPWGITNNMSAVAQIMAWLPGNKPLSEPMLTKVTDAYTPHYGGEQNRRWRIWIITSHCFTWMPLLVMP